MEKVKTINQTHKAYSHEIAKGFYIQAECCMCGTKSLFVGETEKEALTSMTNEGWRELESDLFGLVGNWCGCDYKD